ncbi:M24 family metallopeptidase [Gracilibacillus timonensis]|uniref:M24 family metallopeptidase n=1 Tax=Gracilibacillus timonensis TaxID=1816696 RepID=UPI0008253F67|nr:M24 family metallopeptidase [Gracilibacillus timonensis]
MQIELKEVNLPEFGLEEVLPDVPSEIYETRCREFYAKAGCDWLVVYADREHFANIHYLSAFDPRFEEALLLLGPNQKKYLLLGNECVDYAPVNKINAEVVLYQSFGLLGQDRTQAPRLDHILKDIGMTAADKVGVCGWKYFEENEKIPSSSNLFIPAFIVDCLQNLVNTVLVDVTELLLHPTKGMRVYNEAENLAYFEWGAARSSNAVDQIVRNVEVGMTEHEAVSNMQFAGEILTAHVMFSASKEQIIGLSSPSSKAIEFGDGVTTGVGYWGGLSCRAGVIDKQNDKYLNDLAKPYFKAIAAWYQKTTIGATGGEIWNEIVSILDQAGLKPALNPGHQVSTDEWMNTIMKPGSKEKIASGMAFQCDIIPTPLPDGIGLNCEDSVFFADEELRAEIKEKYPALWERIQRRQQFIREEIGIPIHDDLLPLSNNCAYFSPFWLTPDKVLVVV